MVYDGKVLIVRIRFVLFDGIGVEEKDIKILLGIEKNINIFLIIRYGKKYKVWYFFKFYLGLL